MMLMSHGRDPDDAHDDTDVDADFDDTDVLGMAEKAPADAIDDVRPSLSSPPRHIAGHHRHTRSV
jgi:hypothetical protein